MPLPAIPILVTLGIATLLGGAIALNFTKLKAWLKGKEFAILGPRRVGKTTFLNFLQTGKIEKSYRPTLAPDKFYVSSRAINGKDADPRDRIEITLKQGVDVSGQKAAYASWKRITKTADVVLYLFRADFVLDGDKEHLNRIRSDMGQISIWLKDRPKTNKPAIYLIGTHCDLHSDLKSLEDANVHDNFAQLDAVKEAARTVNADAVLIGSLLNADLAQGLVVRLFKHLMNG